MQYPPLVGVLIRNRKDHGERSGCTQAPTSYFLIRIPQVGERVHKQGDLSKVHRYAPCSKTRPRRLANASVSSVRRGQAGLDPCIFLTSLESWLHMMGDGEDRPDGDANLHNTGEVSRCVSRLSVDWQAKLSSGPVCRSAATPQTPLASGAPFRLFMV